MTSNHDSSKWLLNPKEGLGLTGGSEFRNQTIATKTIGSCPETVGPP